MARPQNIGIKAIELYFPNQCVDQVDLEKFDGVSEGKYTIGLGQTKMGFCDDREDTYSFALTAVSSLLKKNNIDPASIGRLEVGTETLLDKSKSVKSVLMQLFEPSGNTNIEGVDTVNACYGGTNALFNSVAWVESSAWDGRDAIVVAGDIALYHKGNARPTGGAGCVAMLVGPDAPIVVEEGLRGTYMKHAYDFYKPDFTSEYPVVDGQFSLQCYTEAADFCYRAYNKREETLSKRHQNGFLSNGHTNGALTPTTPTTPSVHESPLDRFNYMAFHAPTNKLVSKSYARLLYNDYLANPHAEIFKDVPPHLATIDAKASLTDKEVEKTFMGLTKKKFAGRVAPGASVPRLCGNMYCASVYGALVGLLCSVPPQDLVNARIGIFSYGSGLASTLFSLRIRGDMSEIANKINLHERLDARKVVPPETYEKFCEMRERAHCSKGFKPEGSTEDITKGTYYLTEVDNMFRRHYAIKE